MKIKLIKYLVFVLILNLIIPNFIVSANTDVNINYLSNPGYFRNYYNGTDKQAWTDGDFTTGFPTGFTKTTEALSFKFPVCTVTHIRFWSLSFNTSRAKIQFYNNGVLVRDLPHDGNGTQDNFQPGLNYLAVNVNNGVVNGALCDEIRVTNINVVYEFDFLYSVDYPVLQYFMPSDGSTNISIYETISAIFNLPVSSLTYEFKDETGKVISTTTQGYNTTTIRVNPLQLLNYDTSYTLSISDVKGENGILNSKIYTTTFRTQQDNTPVRLINVIPPDGSKDISPDIGQCILEFDKPNINLDTVNSDNIYITDSSENLIESNISYHVDGSRFVTVLSVPKLNYETDYYINVKGISDTLGNPLETTYSMRFKTTNDPTVFKLVSYRPVNNSVVSLNRKIEVVFSQPISIDDLHYTLKDNDGNIIGNVPNIMGSALHITATLEYGKTYYFEIQSIKSTTGQVLESPLSITFRTMNNTNNNFLNTLIGSMMDLFETVKHYGMIIVISAVSVGVIFVVALWLWKKLRKWLVKS